MDNLAIFMSMLVIFFISFQYSTVKCRFIFYLLFVLVFPFILCDSCYSLLQLVTIKHTSLVSNHAVIFPGWSLFCFCSKLRPRH